MAEVKPEQPPANTHDHSGHYQAVGQGILTSPDGLMIVVSIMCTECGFITSNLQKVAINPQPVSKIALPFVKPKIT